MNANEQIFDNEPPANFPDDADANTATTTQPKTQPEIADEVISGTQPTAEIKPEPQPLHQLSSAPKKKKLVEVLADKYGVEKDKLLNTLKTTVFRQKDNKQISNEQMMTLLVVANEYNLNPFTKEIYAYPDKEGIVPVVGVDGWSRIINEHPMLDGIEFGFSETLTTPHGSEKTCFEWVECRIYRKDRSKPVCVTEFLDEVYRDPFSGQKDGRSYTIKGPWQTHPKRMLRHKALIQCARLALGFTGIKDEDEAQRIIENDMGPADVVDKPAQSKPLQIANATLDEIVTGLRGRLSQIGFDNCMSYARSRVQSEADLEYVSKKLKELAH